MSAARARILPGDCRVAMRRLARAGVTVHAVVCDPPYHLTSIVNRFGKAGAAPARRKQTGAYQRASAGFMGQAWDGGDVAFDPETWRLAFDLLPPGGHLAAFSGTRTYHRMACAIEDAGFEIRDQLGWAYASGFPKSHDVAKGIDKALGAERGRIEVARAKVPAAIRGGHFVEGGDRPYLKRFRETGRHETAGPDPVTEQAAAWQGWGTALKPAWEPICLARKPIAAGSVARQALATGTGGINVGACRGAERSPDEIERLRRAGAAWDKSSAAGNIVGKSYSGSVDGSLHRRDKYAYEPAAGQWPANVLHDGALSLYAGDAARVFYMPKADAEERWGWSGDLGRAVRRDDPALVGLKDGVTFHPTVKPVELMRWLCRLLTPAAAPDGRGGTMRGRVLDPFAGSGSTLVAALAEGFDAIGCEIGPEYRAIAAARLREAQGLAAAPERGDGQRELFG